MSPQFKALVGAAVLAVIVSSCSGGGSKPAVVRSTTTERPTTTTRPSGPTTTTPPGPAVSGPFAKNRNSKGSPLGVLCWTLDEVTLSSVTGAGGAPSGKKKGQPPDAVAGLARLDAVLATGPAELTSVMPKLPDLVRPFAVSLRTDLVGAQALRARLGSDSPKQALDLVFERFFDVESYDDVTDFQSEAAGDSHCDFG